MLKSLANTFCLTFALLLWGGACLAGEALITGIEDGQTLLLSSGDKIRLPGLADPDLDPFQAEKVMASYLKDKLLGQRVSYDENHLPRDRHGRILISPKTASGEAVHHRFIRLGLARVGVNPQGADLVTLLELEQQARQKHLGRWDRQGRGFRIFEAEPFKGRVHGFSLVTGKILKVAERRKMIYLNFGEDWRRDFTIAIEKKLRRKFSAAGRDPLTLEGREVLARGWIEWRNGPYLQLEQPDLLQLLE